MIWTENVGYIAVSVCVPGGTKPEHSNLGLAMAAVQDSLPLERQSMDQVLF